MTFLGDPVSATLALLVSSRERIRLSRLDCEAIQRTSFGHAMEAILRSLSLTPELELLLRHKQVNGDSKESK